MIYYSSVILQGFALLLLMVFTSVDLLMLAAEWGGLASTTVYRRPAEGSFWRRSILINP
jgi:hypothetical protein